MTSFSVRGTGQTHRLRHFHTAELVESWKRVRVSAAGRPDMLTTARSCCCCVGAKQSRRGGLRACVVLPPADTRLQRQQRRREVLSTSGGSRIFKRGWRIRDLGSSTSGIQGTAPNRRLRGEAQQQGVWDRSPQKLNCFVPRHRGERSSSPPFPESATGVDHVVSSLFTSYQWLK